MSNFKTITGLDNQPYFSFFHNDKEYFIWFWLSDGEGSELGKACLAYPRSNGSGGFGPYNVLTEYAHKEKVAANGGTAEFMRKIFLPKVNEYLAAQGGGGIPEEFPIDESDLEQFNWIVKKGLVYSEGQIVLNV